MIKTILLIYILFGFLHVISKARRIKSILENNSVPNTTLIGGILLMVFAWPILFILYGDSQ